MPIVRQSPEVTAAWASRFATHPVAVLYKHSPTCGLCDIAWDEIQAFAEANPEVPVYVVDVFIQRPVSNAIEQALGIRHESPQAIVFRDGAPIWHGSHRRVTHRALAEAVAAPAV
jgi:bacillithiol system protein YtxJ